MPSLSTSPITRRWPAQHWERLQLYSLLTPSGVKAAILLEDIGLLYEAPPRGAPPISVAPPIPHSLA